jgi:uncharacterized protein (TIGR03435 family)
MTHALLLHHLWQSTLCVLLARVLTLALSKNRAAVRYWIWLAASLKFLVPLSLLVSLGAQFGVHTATSSAQPQLSAIVNQISAPVGLAPVTAAPVSAAPDWLPAVLFGVWLCGAAVVLLIWFKSWWNINALRRAAKPLDLSLPIPVMSSSAPLEPGVFGVLRPVLLLPEGIASRLTPDQLETVIAHELCHVQRRDNLTAVLHMLVETLFWFHPLVWWIGNRLAEERERACDEAVLQSAGEPEVYAEGILQVCRLYLESPVACMSGISGADLRSRIQRIMSGVRAHNTTLGRKLLLATVALAVAGVPLLIGVLTPRVGRAESQQTTTSEPAFEVASVKPSSPPDPAAGWRGRLEMIDGGPGTPDPGRIQWRNVRLFDILQRAFDVQNYQIVGPAWLYSRRFDIMANVPKGATREQAMRMMQGLLIDRFQLKFHRESREMPVFAFVVAKGGPRMKASTAVGDSPQKPSADQFPPEGFPKLAPGVKEGITGWITGDGMARVTAKSQSVAQLAEFLVPGLEEPITDATGLDSKYDFTLEFVPEHNRLWDGTLIEASQTPASEYGIRLFEAVQKLGLKLESSRAPVKVVVIDHIEKVPTEN